MHLKEYLIKCGIKEDLHIMLHASFRRIKAFFPGLTIQDLLMTLMDITGPNGSLIMPSFTYCFEHKQGNHTIFNRHTPGRVGAVSEVFRRMPGTIRTSSPTHSFVLWGEISKNISPDNAPESPLGEGSVTGWLANQPESFILLFGVNFNSLSFAHYLETVAPVPWADTFCWYYLDVKPVGISIDGKQKLVEVPGCSKGFTRFEDYLKEKKLLRSLPFPVAMGYFLPVKTLLEQGIPFFRDQYYRLLCDPGMCQACDERWFAHLDLLQHQLIRK